MNVTDAGDVGDVILPEPVNLGNKDINELLFTVGTKNMLLKRRFFKDSNK